MNNETELPADVIEALHANRKIKAVKLLRAQRNLDLTEAVKLIDKYYAENPEMNSQSSYSSSRTEKGIGRFILLIIVIAVLYALYQYTSQSI